MANPIRVSGAVSGTDKTLSFETGKLALQSQGAVVATLGGTTVLTTANAAKDVRPGMEFFPLTVDVEERSYAIALIAMLTSVIAAFLYLRIIVMMWMSEPEAGEAGEPAAGPILLAGAGGGSRAWTGSLSIGLAAAFTIAVGVAPGWLLDVADSISQYAR